MKKLSILSIAFIISTMAMTGCGRRDDRQIDSSKAQLTISTFEGGVGDQWLKNAARLFEEKNKDRDDFQKDKVGVQIIVETDRSASGEKLVNMDFKKDIYFTENVDYYTLANRQKKLADITDILTATNSDNKKIIDKIDQNLLDYMDIDGKVYAVPFYDCIYGLVYDKTLFREKSFYMKDDGKTFTNNPADFGTGPNGIAGDWDDGLPKTYEQFASMMARMVKLQVVPFTYSSSISPEYTSRSLTSFWSDDEGLEDTNLNYNFNGTAHNIVDHIDDEGIAVTKEVEITPENGYLLRSQAGLYNALYFARNVLCSDSANYRSFASNYDVQNAFVTSKHRGGSNKPIAMMFEGTWWENEAEASFDEARSVFGVEDFDYGLMPIPKSSEAKIGDATYMNLNRSFGFISATSNNMKLAKEFFAFLHTDEQLRAFTLETNMTRALSYTFDSAERENISGYANDLMSIKESEHVNIVYPYSGLDFFVDNGTIFNTENWPWSTKKYSYSPIIRFIGDKNLSAQTYFEDHASMISAGDWQLMF